MPRQALAAMKRRRTQPEERLLELVKDGIDTITEAAHELDMTKGAVSKKSTAGCSYRLSRETSVKRFQGFTDWWE